MSDSVLTSTKKILGIPEEHTAFDLEVITHLNSSFGTLQQLGVLPEEGYFITDSTATWVDFPSGDATLTNMCKTYVWLSCKLLFDPPATSFNLNAREESKKEHEWRIKVRAEELRGLIA